MGPKSFQHSAADIKLLPFAQNFLLNLKLVIQIIYGIGMPYSGIQKYCTGLYLHNHMTDLQGIKTNL